MRNVILGGFLLIVVASCQVTPATSVVTPTIQSPASLEPVTELIPTKIPTEIPPVYMPEIVFTSDRDGDSEIYTMTAEGKDVKRLTSNSGSDWDPKWSPDGSQILFLSDRDSHPFPYVMNSDGSSQRPISQDFFTEYHVEAKWSSDSQLIAAWNESSFHIVKASDGSQLFQKKLPTIDIAWSPDGTQLGIVSHSNNAFNISILDLNGNKIRKVTSLNDEIHLISWSPDGGKFALSISGGFGDLADIFTLNIDGTNLRNLTDNKGAYWLSGWTPDGKYILSDGPRSPYLISADGSKVIQVSKQPEPYDPTFDDVRPRLSPDGTKIIFSYNANGQYEIYTINVDGSGLTNITENPAYDDYPDWTIPPKNQQLPSYKVAAFYYPWYRGQSGKPQYWHWNQNDHIPPDDIASDYYPELGPYSSLDPTIIDQHMQWIHKAGVGVIIVSWWGQNRQNEQEIIPRILDIAEKYGVKVAFHIEPYDGRSAEKLVGDIKYIYENYGNHPAFFRSTSTSRFITNEQAKGMFFVWSVGVNNNLEKKAVGPEYWRKAVDSIHSLYNGSLIIANTDDSSWIEAGHFDGLYNYATLNKDADFSWSRSLPPNALYIPSVIPGFSAQRVGYPADQFLAREDGDTYNSQWTSALSTGVEPAMVTITSFNEWHEGSMIEPIKVGMSDGKGYSYTDFGKLLPDGYLTLTHEWVGNYLSTQWPSTYKARIKISTTSDWTTLNVISGGAWIRPELVSASAKVEKAGFEAGDHMILAQTSDEATGGKQVEMVWDVLFTGLSSGKDVVFQIDRGNIGFTEVTIYNYIGAGPVTIKTFNWDGVTKERNSFQFAVPAGTLISQTP